jgi:phage terminase large subunit-like protein
VSTEILKLSDYRRVDDVGENEIDLVTAVDAAIRDLHEILMFWGSEVARQRTEECEQMLHRAYLKSVAGQSDGQL